MPETIEVKVPDIGDFKDVPVIEIFVKPGDAVKAEDSLITVESDKATMEVPSPIAGVVKELKVKIGDKVSEGSLVILLEKAGDGGAKPAAAKAPEAAPPKPAAPAAPPKAAPAPKTEAPAPAPAPRAQPAPQAAAPAPAPVDEAGFGKAHASPSVRRFAREL